MIFVTGAQGYIGSHFVHLLEKEKLPHIKLTGELENVCASQLVNVETVVHLAQCKDRSESFQLPKTYFSNNVYGTYHLLKVCNEAKVKRFVYVSSAAVYGDNSPYALTKILCEVLVTRFFKGIHVVLRVFNAYGDGGGGVRDLWDNAKELCVHGDGTQTRDFIHVDKVAEWILKACQYRENVVEDVGTGKSTRIIDLARQYAKPITFLADTDVGIKHSVANLRDKK